jgi:protein TonB
MACECTLVRSARLGFCVLVAALIAISSAGAASPHKYARLVHVAEPKVPLNARRQHLRGDGYFMMHVRPDGSVSKVDVLRSTGHKVLDDAAVGALAKWRFKPGTQSEVRVPFSFAL